ncbi:MAG: XdhC family protein [Cohaesibacter sp.]|nr:XdhC family protein [Cohaesibacter sp.]
MTSNASFSFLTSRDRFLNIETDFVTSKMPYARVTVVRVEGTAASRVGDRYIATSDGELLGFTGGGCIRSAVKKAAKEVLASGLTKLVHAVPKAKADAPDDGRGTQRVVNHCPSQGELEFFVEPIFPKPAVALYGQSYLAQILKELIAFAGFNPVVQEGEETEAYSPYAVIVTMGQGDLKALQTTLTAGYEHILFVASNKKVQHLKNKLAEEFEPSLIARIISPAGLAIGAQSPEEIAISIVAQLIEHRRLMAGEEKQ